MPLIDWEGKSCTLKLFPGLGGYPLYIKIPISTVLICIILKIYKYMYIKDTWQLYQVLQHKGNIMTVPSFNCDTLKILK